MIDNNHSENHDEFISDDDLLGSNSEIAVKLRQFYTAIQDEAIPDKFLDLLEKLDQVEKASAAHIHKGDEVHD